MFVFFRRYQRLIFVFVTIVIVLSFSFFGTYSTFVSNSADDPVVFTCVDGTKMRKSTFMEYVRFLSADSLSIGEGAPFNALNDGAIAKDIVQSGVGDALVQRFKETFATDWATKYPREKRFQPYQHPQAPFISAQQVWNYFAPDIARDLEAYQSSFDQDPDEVYKKKAALFLAEKTFSPTYLRQILAYQQQQFQWLEPDESLYSRPLSLFGYGCVSDWFGANFVERAVELIIQVASKARKEGFSISQQESLASIHQNVEKALQKLPQSEKISAQELFQRSLFQLNMDSARAAKIWGDLLLFRRYVNELPLQMVVNTEPFDSYLKEQFQQCDFTCYQLQPCLRLAALREMMKVETWANAVGKERATLGLPKMVLAPKEVLVAWPEFVEQLFSLKIVATSLEETPMRIRDIWNWQVDHFEKIAENIPILKVEERVSREEKLQALDQLSPQLRSQADLMAKKALIEMHPEWIEQAFERQGSHSEIVGVRLKGGKLPFEGLKDRYHLLQKLEVAQLEEPFVYTQDNDHFYQIEVVEKGDLRLVPLPDLLDDGTLDTVLDRLLETLYGRINGESEFQDEKGEVRPFDQVKEQVAMRYFFSLINQLDSSVDRWKKILPNYCQWDNQTSARVAVYFLPMLTQLGAEIEKGNIDVVTDPILSRKDAPLTMTGRPVQDLDKLVATDKSVLYHEVQPSCTDLFTQEEGTWLQPRYSQEYGPFIARIEKRNVRAYDDALRESVYVTQKVVGKEMVETFSTTLIKEFFPE